MPTSLVAAIGCGTLKSESEAVNGAFGKTVAPLFSRLKIAPYRSTILGALRDALLPKLTSGELRIADSEQMIAGPLEISECRF
jgi:hypothetical protein